MIAALAIAACILSLLRLSGGSKNIATFRGGSVRVHQVSYGTKHTFVPGPVWHRMLAIMPTNITRALKIDMRIEQTKEPTLMIWFEWKGKVNAPLPSFLQLGDSRGLFSNMYFMGRSVRLTNHFFYAFVIDNFPRHEKEIIAELFWVPANQHEKLAQFHIRNPAYRKASKPEPQIQLNAEAEGQKFTLLALNTGLYATGHLAQMSFNSQWTELVFRAGTNESAQRTFSSPPVDRGPWEIANVELSDHYGNVVADRVPSGRIFPVGDRRDDGIALVRGAVWPSGNWKVRATFDRVTPFTDERHLWRTTIPVPNGAGRLSISDTGHIEIAQVYLDSVENLAASNQCSLSFHSIAPASVIRIVELKDQRGTNLAYHYRSSQGTYQQIDFQPPPESRSVQVTFARSHPVTVEFVSPVTIRRTNVAHWAPVASPATPPH